MILHETSGPCNLLSQSSSSVHVKQQLVKGCGAPIQKDIIYIFRPLLIFIYYNLHAQYIKLSLCIETISSCLFLERSILLSSPPTVCLDPVLTISCTYVDSTWRLFTHSPSTHTRHFKPGSCKNQPSTIQWSFFNKLLQGEKKSCKMTQLHLLPAPERISHAHTFAVMISRAHQPSSRLAARYQ